MPRRRPPLRPRRPSDPRRRSIGFLAIASVSLYLVGLAGLYLLTPAHSIVEPWLFRPTPVPLQIPVSHQSTPTSVQVERKLGADVGSVAGVKPSVAEPTDTPTSTTEQRFAVLLMGYGGAGHDGAYLTDSMMVVIVDPVHKSLALLSIPRDSWVPLSFDGTTTIYNKINAAYAFAEDPSLYPDRLLRYQGKTGPGTLSSDTVTHILGIPIQYYLSLDFAGFKQMIDTVGGVDVNVPDGFSARYPRNDDPSIDASWTVVRFRKGPEHMMGARAIEYARARETLNNIAEGTDFARSRRQRLIMEAFKTRLFQPGGLIHLPQLLAIAATHVDTNYTIPAIGKLSNLVLGWKDVKIYQTALTDTNYLEDATGPDGTYLAVPSDPNHTWAQVRAFTRRLWADPAAGVAMARTVIICENDTGVPGVAGQLSDALLQLGYRVGTPTTGTMRETTALVDHTGGASAALLKQLGDTLGIGTLTPTDGAVDGSSQLVIKLGVDNADLTVTAPTDRTAPSSIVGVVQFGVWPYVAPQPTIVASSLPLPAAPPTALATATGPARFTIRATPTPDRGARPQVTPTKAIPAMETPAPETPTKEAPVIDLTPKVAPPQIVVPNLIGMPVTSAEKLILSQGMLSADVNYQTFGDVADHHYYLSIPPGGVLSQSLQPGLHVSKGAKIVLSVRKA